MGTYVEGSWLPDFTAPGPRRAKVAGRYRAFLPDPLVARPLWLDARVSADVADAEIRLAALDQRVQTSPAPHRLEVLARLLLRAEAVASSQIEGLVVSPRRLALADLDPALDPAKHATAVLGNVRALQRALELADRPGPVTPDDICGLHARLLEGGPDAAWGGKIRNIQNWIGGYTPVDAAYVPPPPERVPDLMNDLCAYLSGTEHSPLIQAALVHAQFESIHPFADGNGRAGRVLIHLVLRRRGLCRRFVPPVSLVLATWSQRYIDALMGTRVDAPAGSPPDLEGQATWIETVAYATRVACDQADAYDARMSALVETWRERLHELPHPPRADAAVWELLPWLPAWPLVTASAAATWTGRSPRAIDAAIALLVEHGILRQVRGRVRHRVYEAEGVFDRLTEAERALASPALDTRQAPPVRAVPARVR